MTFRTKPEIALAQIGAALAAGAAPGVLLTDAGHGADGAFRSGVTASGLTYVVGVQSTLSVRPPVPNRCRPNPGAGGAARLRACTARATISLFPPRRRRGGFPRRLGTSFHGGRALTNRVFALRRRTDPDGLSGLESIDAPSAGIASHRMARGEKEPTKYWLSTLPQDTPLDVLVDTAKLCWPIERDYEELKSELDLAHFEGRSWRGFHYHATLCDAAYGWR